MSSYRQNHYVPVWYDERFDPDNAKERKYKYLDLNPEVRMSGDHGYTRRG